MEFKRHSQFSSEWCTTLSQTLFFLKKHSRPLSPVTYSLIVHFRRCSDLSAQNRQQKHKVTSILYNPKPDSRPLMMGMGTRGSVHVRERLIYKASLLHRELFMDSWMFHIGCKIIDKGTCECWSDSHGYCLIERERDEW